MGDFAARDLHILAHLDEQPVQKFHWGSVITTGMGFFTDAYDLFIIGTVTTMLRHLWNIGTTELSLLNSASLLSAAIGSLVFGWLMDRYGRKLMYGVEAVLLIVGALASACAPDFAWLLAARLLLGIGVGGDYPASAVIISEFANRPNRGRLIATVFAMQGLGLVTGPLVAMIVLTAGFKAAVAWRVLLGLGAIPAALAFFLRRRMPETPRFLLHVRGDAAETQHVVDRMSGRHGSTRIEPSTRPAYRIRSTSFFDPPFFRRLVGATVAWCLVDIVFYGNGISSHMILQTLNPSADLIRSTKTQLLLFAATALPGYIVAALLVDTLGRKVIQWVGFAITGCAYLTLDMVPRMLQDHALFLVMYGLSYFFIEFGPNSTTFIYPSEIFPTHLRGRGHGVAAAGGKLGAFVAAFMIPWLLPRMGLGTIFGVLGVLSLLGVWVTVQFLPEPRRRALEELNGRLGSDRVHETYTRILESIHEESLDDTVAEELLSVSGSDLVAIYRAEQGDPVLTPASVKTQDRAMTPLADVLLNPIYILTTRPASHWEEIIGDAFRHEAIQVIAALPAGRHPAERLAARLGLRSLAALPMTVDGQIVGVVVLFDREERSFSPERIAKLGTFVQLVSIALLRTQQFHSFRMMAMTDALTRLLNRRGFEEELELRMDRAANNRMAFVIADLDNFKDINDRLGHQAGDAALRDVSRHLRDALVNQDMVARLGGDEFILLFEHVHSTEEAYQRLVSVLATVPWRTWGLGVSAGMAFYPDEGRTYQDLYRVADARLYRAKNGGRGRIEHTGDTELEEQPTGAHLL